MFEEPKPFDRMIARAKAAGPDSVRPDRPASDQHGRARLRPDGLPGATAPGNPFVGSIDEAPATSAIALRTGEAMRAIEWHELTARLNAARDLRRELRSEASLCAGSSGASFGDAAERYFKALSHGERPVNLDALEGSKGSSGIVSQSDKDAAKHVARGVAREQDD